MSAKKETGTNNDDEGSKDLKIITEGNSLSLDSSENNSAVSENVRRSAADQSSGDDLGSILQENIHKPDDTEIELPKEFIIPEAGTGDGDHTAKTKDTDIDDQNIEDFGNIEDLDSDAKSSGIKMDDKALSNIDEMDDEDMELRWDDDDGSNSAAGDDNTVAKIDEFLSEEQLLEEPSTFISKEMSKTYSEIPKSSRDKLQSDKLDCKSEENIQSEIKSLRQIDTSKEYESSLKLTVPPENAEDEKSLEDELLKEPDLNPEAIKSPEMDFDLLQEPEDLNTETINSPEIEFDISKETDLNAEDINSPEANEPQEKSEVQEHGNFPKTEVMNNFGMHIITHAKEILEDMSMVEKLEESETDRGEEVIAEAKSILEDEIMVKEIEESEMNSANDVIAEAKCLLQEECTVEVVREPLVSNEMEVISEPKEIHEEKSIANELEEPEISSEMQVLDDTIEILGEQSMIEPKKVTGSIKINLLKKASKDKHTKEVPENIIEDQLLAEPQNTEKGIESPFIMPEIEVPINKKDTDVLLEDVIEDTAVEAIPESDITMEVDDDKEVELLKDRQDDSCTPMDVDITDQSIVNQSMDNQSDIEKKDSTHQFDVQIIEEKGNIDEPKDEVKSRDQSDDQGFITSEGNTDQTLEETKTVEVIKDTTSEDQNKIGKNTVNEVKSEKENVEYVIDDENKMKDTNKEQFVTEQSTKSPKETVSNTANVVTEGQENPVTKNSRLETETEDKLEPETPKEITKNVNKTADLEKTENIKDTVDPVTGSNKNDDEDEISPKQSSIFFEDSPVPIKTNHGLHKPDVMLEIPTQELIDMDDTDFSMNLDQSDVMVSLSDVYEEVEHEKTVDESVPVGTVNERSVDQTSDVDTVKEKSVDQTKHDDGTVKEKSVDQKAESTKTIPSENITAKDNSAHQEDIVAEPTATEVRNDSETVVNDKIVKEFVLEATIEENMEKMFADDEPDVAKEVPQPVATTSQTQQPPEQPPPTQMTPDTSDAVPEICDSLGLLAESTGRVMEDDEEPEDDDDSDHDESSNQISAEQSEDSNQAALDTEPDQQEDKDLDTPDPKDEEFPFMVCDSTSQDEMEKMDVEDNFGTMELQAATVNEMTEEAQSAVDALLNADNPVIEQTEEKPESAEEEQMDIETVKLSDTSDNEVDVEPTEVQQPDELSRETEEDQQMRFPSESALNPDVSTKKSPRKPASSPSKQSLSQIKNLDLDTQGASSLYSIVDLEESSSSEDDIQEVQRQLEPDTTSNDKPPSPGLDSEVTNVNIPTGIEIMCTSGGSMSEITTKEGEVVISGVPKPPPHKPARLNTGEVSIKTVSVEAMVIPETMIQDQTQTQSKAKLGLEIFSLDSDDEDSATKDPESMTAAEMEKARETSKCINYCCKSEGKEPLKVADASVVAYYDSGRKRRSMVCQPCADVVAERTKNLIQGIKDLKPLLDLEMSKLSQDLVEISDSESEDEDVTTDEPKETIGEKGAKFIEENLAKYLNETWEKYEMDVRLKETQIMLDDEIEKLEQDSKEIDAMLNECQVATDKLRCELYATFQCRRQKLPPLMIYDTLDFNYIGPEKQETAPVVESIETRQKKRRLSSTSEMPAKRPAIPLGYAPLDGSDTDKTGFPGPDFKMDDDKDISVVKLSAEAAPAELPPPGEISRPPLRVGMPVCAMKNAFGPWLKGRILEIQPKNPSAGNPFALCRVKFDHKTKTNGKVLPSRCIAYSEPADVRMTIGTRLIALFKDTNKRESYYSGVVAEIPNPVNNYRYLVFFDDGYAQYVQHQYTRLVYESAPLVWDEVHPFSREFVRQYLLSYPERPMVRLHEGQHLKIEWNGKWWSSRVLRVDASLAQVLFVGDGRREWIYRGSTRLAPLYLELRAAERHRPRPMPRSKAQPRLNMPYVEYTRSDEQESNKQVDLTQTQQEQQQEIQNEEIRRQRAVAKKSTSAAPQALAAQHPAPPARAAGDSVTSRVVYYTPKNAVRPLKMVPHKCSPKCKRTDVLTLKELKSYNPLAKPLLSGWERQIVRFKGHKDVFYRAPCGRRLRDMRELHHYLRTIDSDLPVDLFDFHYTTHCLAEFVLNKYLVGKKDLSHGKENVPIPCVNYYDESLPEFCSYNTERTPTAGVPLNLEPDFLCGCDCTDDCQDKTKCACWKMTLEGARTIGLDGPNVGYVYRRLPEPLPSGIYECNSRCKCKHTCLNRVAQHPLQLKLQVFKTPNRGWGIRALNDVPKGSFLCVYAGNLLTDATANLDGLNEGDEYLAELDYIEVVEQMKEGYEEDIPEADKKLDKKELGGDGDSDEDEPSSSEDEDTNSKTDKEDDDFRPGYIGLGVTEFNKHLRKREKSKRNKEKSATDEKEKEKDTTKDKETKEPNAEEDCITISDDEEVREPSRFMAQTNMGANEYISKYKSVRTLFGKDEACYIMDAKVQGNIGRYLNHSCCPNVFVQNVFVDTHDPRFPWVAFFALCHIKAGTELTWNYNYDVGSVPGKVLYCYCGAVNCRGRLL